MPQKSTMNVSRLIVPLLLLAGLIGLGYVLFKPSKPATPTPTTPPAAATGTQPITTPGASPTTPSASAAPPSLGALSVKQQAPEAWANLGSLAPSGDAGPKMEIVFHPIGAGIGTLKLADHKETIQPNSNPEQLQAAETVVTVINDGTKNIERSTSIVPFALTEVAVNGSAVSLASSSAWKQLAPGEFVAEIVAADGKGVLRVRRKWTLQPGRYDLVLDQSFTNLTDQPIDVKFAQFGAIDLPKGVIRYGGDQRYVRLGYLPGLSSDPTGQTVYGRELQVQRPAALGHGFNTGSEWVYPASEFWPGPKTAEYGQSVSWFGMRNRFFAVTAEAIHDRRQRTDTTPPGADKRLTFVEKIDRVVLIKKIDPKTGTPDEDAAMALRLISTQSRIEPGKALDASMGVFAGPVWKRELVKEPLPSVAVDQLEVYSFGSCAWCTFQPVAYFLRSFLTILKTFVTMDWALAIILLVVCVRTLLHPITKWSQISLQRFGKQMQKLAPKQKALQEKFKDDPKKLREETAILMREEKVNYAGALGCLPMFLQTPIWIGLSSLMFFLFDLRHTPAFFGIFQSITNHGWHFLADLAEPDRFVSLPTSFTLPVMGMVDSINILPIILGIVFFIQQKYLTPPPTAPQSPEMEMQMKIMKVMMIFMFPLMMYNAPSGLAIYFITNSTLGILESKYIRKQFEAQEKAREEELAKNPKAAKYAGAASSEPTGFIGKLMKRLADAKARAEQMKAMKEAQANMPKNPYKPPGGRSYPPGHKR